MMKIDLYTKIVLTVIAACLIVLVLGGSGIAPLAQADYGTQDVRIVGVSTPLEVKIVSIEEGYGEGWEALPVEIKGGVTIPVEIQSGATIPVKIQSVASYTDFALSVRVQ